MKAVAIIGAMLGLALCPATFAKRPQSVLIVASDAGLNAGSPRVVNVTSDSPPEWIPSEDLERALFAATKVYFSALDAGNYSKIYRMMTEGNRNLQTEAQFLAMKRKFHSRAGSVKQRTILKLNWSKNPQSAPSKGVYAAIDVTAHYAKIDRHCGYIVLFQSQPGAPFELARSEDNTLDNASARMIERQQSKEAVDKSWADLAANCPNYLVPSSLQ